MDDLAKLFTTFMDAIALLMALVLMVSILRRGDRKKLRHSLLMGALFSFALIYTMSDPIRLQTGGIFDMRGLLIGVGAALFGPIVGVMTLLTGIVYRVFIGNPGVVPGVVGMVVAFGAGLLWRRFIKNRAWATWKKSTLLGVMITFQLMSILMVPMALWGTFFMQLFPYTIAANVLGALLINHLISGEISFLSEAETSKVSAPTDHLTGVLNRRGLEAVYPDLAKLNGPPRGRALLYFDIDRFKAVNDQLGHAVGDDVLKFVTDQVRQNLRPNDVFARIGGDEFVVVLSQIDQPEAERIAERCRMVVEAGGFQRDGHLVPISISVGGVWMLEHTEIDEILDEADRALYAAKSGGRNMVVFGADLAKIGALVPARFGCDHAPHCPDASCSLSTSFRS